MRPSRFFSRRRARKLIKAFAANPPHDAAAGVWSPTINDELGAKRQHIRDGSYRHRGWTLSFANGRCTGAIRDDRREAFAK